MKAPSARDDAPASEDDENQIDTFHATYNHSRFKDFKTADGTTTRLLYPPDLEGKTGKEVERIATDTLKTISVCGFLDQFHHQRLNDEINGGDDRTPYNELTLRTHYAHAVLFDFLRYAIKYPDGVFEVL